MVVGLTHASFKRLAPELNGTVMTPGRSDAFPYRFQEVAVATTTSTYTCIILSQPRSMAAQDIDCFFFLEIHNLASSEDYQSQVHHVSQAPSTRVGRRLYRICRLHSHSSATHNTSLLISRSPCSLANPAGVHCRRRSFARQTNLPLRGVRSIYERF